MASDRVAFQGLPARICWLGLGERARMGARFNDMVASGSSRRPSSSVATTSTAARWPRPTGRPKAMADGSDAIADWPLLNAMVNVASGASWVSIHDGGGVGIGRSLHAGQVSSPTARRWPPPSSNGSSPTTRPWACIRHVDAGYREARQVADAAGLDIPAPARSRR